MTEPSFHRRHDDPSLLADEPELERWQQEVAEAEEEAKSAKPLAWVRWLVVLALLALAVHLIIPQLGSLQESAKVLKTMRPWAVALAILSEILSYVALGYMMKRIVGLTGQVLTLNRAFAVTLASGSVGLIAGGLVGIGGSSFRWLRDAGIRAEGALLAGWLPTLLNAATIAVFALIGMVELVIFQDLSPALWIAFSLSLALLIVVAVALFWGSSHREAAKDKLCRLQARWARLRKKEPTPEKLMGTVDRLFDAFHILKTRGWKAPVAAAALGVVLDMGAMFWLFIAAGRPVTPGKLLSGYALPLLIGKVAVIPGGIGLVEGTMIALYHGFAVPTATAVLVVLAYRVIAFWMPNLIGLGMIPLLHIPTKRSGRDLQHPHWRRRQTDKERAEGTPAAD
ncbi:lysylphosphatidylglycerol synthase transmembrane domain-containing protein [Longimicrobium sp.]|uniref:lysylphosphatidylglycerol synthase transmembrane domain-containing protein n=1 Tax=Longimicrobium sp. TaxID=2029185 RepID=UPI002C9BDD6A|nr:lysylphosphatidylglycerol synthase transmembrane domain-containing protein [Longimicrobium sp.]HSU16443.1 lysylphosphatidylglycerol synthase transmembrane domain-containing protein [Longimicrobium sp.]